MVWSPLHYFVNGRQHPSSCNLPYVHDFIEIRLSPIFKKSLELVDLYEQGYSILEIAAQMGLAYSTTRDALVKDGVALRANKSVSFLKDQRQSFKNSTPPPYGYCYLEGRLQKDPREFPTLQIIKKQRQLGRTPTEIARFLNGKRLKTRKGKAWRQSHVFNLVRRLEGKINN